ncbi:MAG: GTPase [Planctomycetota bacterium]
MKKNEQESAFASLLTPPSPSGISVIALQGPGSEAVISGLFRPARNRKYSVTAASRAQYGYLYHHEEMLDEVLLISRHRREAGYEICCHGGTASATAILKALAESGVSVRPWSALIKDKTLERELLIDLMQSRGANQAALLAHLRGGCLHKAFHDFEKALALLEQCESSTSRDGVYEETLSLATSLDAGYELGRYLHRPPRIFITGLPNTGKSTLFNAILGEQRVLTSRIPGTTRDTVESVFLLQGFPVRLFDTPGLVTDRKPGLDAEAQDVAEQLMEEADLRLHLVTPGRDGLVDIGSAGALPRSCSKADRILIVNKSDLLVSSLSRSHASKGHGEWGDPVLLSALKRQGIEPLLERIDRTLGLERLRNVFEPWLFNRKQRVIVRKVISAITTRNPNPDLREKINYYLSGRLYP